MIKKLIPLLLIGILLIGIGCIGNDDDEEDLDLDVDEIKGEVTIYYFWGEGCPVCEEKEPFIQQLKEHENIKVEKHELPGKPGLYEDIAEAYGLQEMEMGAVPATFIGEEYWVGYSEDIHREEIRKIEECLETGECINPKEK